MKITFSAHSLEKLKERNIPKKKIRKILKNPDEVRKGKYERDVAHRFENNKLIRVVYIEKGERGHVVITAYKTDSERYGGKK